MDPQTALICLGVFLVSAAVVYLISVFGIRETTYEEALAEQRRKDEVTLQLKKSDKSGGKLDHKKHKKWGRKSKEKSVDGSGNKSDDDVRDEHAGHVVGFKAEAEIIPELKEEEERERRASAAKISKFQEPKPILVNKKNKEKSTTAAVTEQPAKQSEPQKKASSKEGTPVEATKPASGRKSRESSNEKETEKTVEPDKPAPKEIKREDPVPPQPQPAENPPKKVKKTKAEDEILTCGRLTNIIKSSVLSPSEITALIETLLNKQQAESGSEEWLKIGQKVDPLTALRKQLQEKEEALAEEKMRAQTSGAKLKELRQEINAEKTRSNQVERNLKEKHQQELQAAHSRCHMASNDANNLRNQVQQLQAKLNEDHHIAKQYMEEKNQLTQALNHSESNNENLKREIDEMRDSVLSATQLQELVRQLEMSKKEDENTHNASVSDLRQQIRTLSDEKDYLEKMLAESGPLQENLAQLKKTVTDMTSTQTHNQEAYNQLLSTVEDLKQEKNNLENQISNHQFKFNQLMADKTKLESELAALKEENDLLAAQLSKVSQREEAEGQEGSGDGCVHDKSNGHVEAADDTKIALTEHENILHEKEKLVDRLSSELNDKKNELNEVRNKLLATEDEIKRVVTDADLQKQKNNELREKNWKVVEALNAAEKSTNDKIKQADKLANERLSEVQKQEQLFTQELLQRLFPEIKLENSIVYTEWTSRFEKEALQVIDKLYKSSSVVPQDEELANKYTSLEDRYNKLQTTVQNYKVVLEKTEGMLKQLQGSVEEEEQRWKEKLEAKELELQKALEDRRNLEISLEEVHAAEEMQENLKELHEKLKSEENERRLLEKYKSEAENSASHFHEKLKEAEDSISKLKSERESLNESAKELGSVKEEIEKLKQQNKELASQNTKLNGQLKIGQDALRFEQDQVHQLQEKLKLITNDTKQVGASNGQSTDNGENTIALETRFKGDTGAMMTSLCPQETAVANDNLSTTSSTSNNELISSSNKKSKSKTKQQRVRRSLSDSSLATSLSTFSPHPTPQPYTFGQQLAHTQISSTSNNTKNIEFTQHSFSSACLYSQKPSNTLGSALYPLVPHARLAFSGSVQILTNRALTKSGCNINNTP